MDLFAGVIDHNCFACGRVHSPTCEVVLVGGETVSAYSEAWRLECEARAILSRGTTETRALHLSKIEKRRGKPAADQLKAKMLEIWNASKLARAA